MKLRFVDLFAGLGGFHHALGSLGHECVFASEINDELREIYSRQFFKSAPLRANAIVHGDIRSTKHLVPSHDILCAGFPCQPFSKSGAQVGLGDKTRGTLFHEIIEILQKHRPEFVILENVGNFERHNSGRTWSIVKQSLERLGYAVHGTTHKTTGGGGLLSPHHLGHPQHRERFFIVGTLTPLARDPFPCRRKDHIVAISELIQPRSELSPTDILESALSPQQTDCIEHWNSFLKHIPSNQDLPSFPIWGEEFGASYPFEEATPSSTRLSELKRTMADWLHEFPLSKKDLISLLPSYARTEEKVFPPWKISFIRQNREWFAKVRASLPVDWHDTLAEFPPSLRKLEWNCQGEERDLWRHILQFRPSGLRVKRFTTAPALIAMTTTQIPILGPKRRFLTRVEGLRLQGFPDTQILPTSRTRAFAALGNAVHVSVVKAIAEQALNSQQPLHNTEVFRVSA